MAHLYDNLLSPDSNLTFDGEIFDTTEEMFEIADSWLQTNKNFKKNDKVVIVAGTPPNEEAATNLIRVMKIGE